MKELVRRQRLMALGLIGALALILLFPVLAPVAVGVGGVIVAAEVATVGLGVAGSASIGTATALGTLPLRIRDNSRANELTARACKGGYALGTTLPQRIWDNGGAQRDVERAFGWERRNGSPRERTGARALDGEGRRTRISFRSGSGSSSR